MTNAPVALVPVNRLAGAKQRLAGVLTPAQRRFLALATLRTVVGSAVAAGFEPVILTADGEVGAEFPGVRLLSEEPGAGLNRCLERALVELGLPSPLLILHSDLPLASGENLARLLGGGGDRSVSLVRSRDGGTNAMLLTPPGLFPLAYGPRSFARHVAAAHLAGLSVEAIDDPDLALDLDTAADLDALVSRERGRLTDAGRLLAGWGWSPSAP